MFSMSGIIISEGVSEGRAFVLTPQHVVDSVNTVGVLSASEEMSQYRNASHNFANKLNNAMSGTVPDKIRDIFGAVAAYITHKNNILAIEQCINQGYSAIEAAQKILLPKIQQLTCADEEEEQSIEVELETLMREFIMSMRCHSVYGEDACPQINEPSIVIASDLSPAQLLSLHTELVRAVILEDGQSSNHLSTILRDLHIPAIYDVKGALTIKNGQYVLVDANRGTILVEPPQDTARAIIEQQYRFSSDDDYDLDNDLGVTVASSMGAIGEIGRLEHSLKNGLGLLRSEFLFLNYREEPSCEQMRTTFAKIFSKIPKSAPLAARTFDFAGDKKPFFPLNLDEKGPLRKYGAKVGSELLRREMMALLLAAPGREIHIVFPLITRLSEAKALNELLSSVIEELENEGASFGHAVVVLMIETPAAVLSARAFAAYGEMFLIGTSSLAEYAAAPRPAEEYFTPALSKMIAIACKAAADEGKQVGVAGRFAMRTELLPFYLQLGVSYITTDSISVHKIRRELQHLADRGLEPHFDAGLYANLMEIASAFDLQNLIFREDLSF